MAFYVGQKVVALKTWNWNKGPAPKQGCVYTIRALLTEGTKPSLWLAEIVNEPTYWGNLSYPLEVGWSREYFRPVVERKTDISIFTEMLKPKQRELTSNHQ